MHLCLSNVSICECFANVTMYQCACVCMCMYVYVYVYVYVYEYVPLYATPTNLQEGVGPTGSRGARIIWVDSDHIVISGFNRYNIPAV